MADTKYILRYLPLFYEELEEKVVYIAEKLKDICKGAVALSNQCEAPFLCKKITARPRKNPAVGVKLMYGQTH